MDGTVKSSTEIPEIVTMWLFKEKSERMKTTAQGADSQSGGGGIVKTFVGWQHKNSFSHIQPIVK